MSVLINTIHNEIFLEWRLRAKIYKNMIIGERATTSTIDRKVQTNLMDRKV